MRISTTTLESFRLFVEQDWMEEASLIATIKREVVVTEAMQLGTAFHAVIEDPDRYRVLAGYHCDGFSFPADTMQPLLSLIDRRGPFEIKSTRAFGPHTVVAKADQIVGARIYEHKTTCSGFDAERYLDSYQWRFECAIFQPVSVTYRVACLEEPREGIVGFKALEQLTVYPYPALGSDCADLVRRFVTYVTARGLTSYLERPGSDVDLAA